MRKTFVFVLLLMVCVLGFAQKTQNKKHLNIAMMLPLYYDNIDELSFNAYNIDERRTKPFKCFSFLGFYEGARIALDRLEKEGCNVSLYVYDTPENDVNKTRQVLQRPEMKDMDLILPLVYKAPFEEISRFSQENQIAVVNPMSSAADILSNPYLFRIQPSDISIAKTVIKYIETKHSSANVIVLYDDSRTANKLLNYYKEELPKAVASWTILNYRKNASKLKNYLKGKNNIVVKLTEMTSDKENRSYASTLIKKLNEYKDRNIMLIADYSWIEYAGANYQNLENLSFHFPLTYLNDYSNAGFVDFVKQYRSNFKTEPDKIYAALGYDIMLYFVTAMNEKGSAFATDPNVKNSKYMVNHYHFLRTDAKNGWENETTTIYGMKDYKIRSEWSY